MWIITGIFDNEDRNDETLKSKLLKPGKTYTIGRPLKGGGGSDILCNKAWISTVHASVTVGELSVADVAKHDVLPTLHYRHQGAKAHAHLIRNDEIERPHISVDTESIELHSGDRLQVSVKTMDSTGCWTFTWQPLFVSFLRLAKTQVPPTSARAASLGFHLTRTFTPHMTHFVAGKIDKSVERLYTALMACAEIVNEGWWTDVCERAEAPKELEKSWENTFPGLEGIGQWPPILDDGLEILALEPDPRRRELFTGLTFVLLNDASPLADLTAQLELGGAKVESIDLLSLQTTSVSLMPILEGIRSVATERLASSGRLDKTQISSGMRVVLAKKVVQDLLGKNWPKYEDMITSLGMPILSPEQIQHSILTVSTAEIIPVSQTTPMADSLFVRPPRPRRLVAATESNPDTGGQPSAPSNGQHSSSSSAVVQPSSSVLPDFVPETAQESHIPATFPEQSINPAPAQQSAPKWKRRRNLTLMEDLLIGDDTVVIEPPKELTPDPEPRPRPAAPLSTAKPRKRTRLHDIFSDVEDDDQRFEEPAYKKYKKEVEEREKGEKYQKESKEAGAVVDAVYRQSKGETVQIPTLTQTELDVFHGHDADNVLDRIEEDEVMEVVPPPTKKRSRVEDIDVDMDQPVSPPPKRRQTRASSVVSDSSVARTTSRAPPKLVNSRTASAANPRVITPPPSQDLATAAVKAVLKTKNPAGKNKASPSDEAQMDTDQKFLQALASRKRGKKKEDDFDRDFNALKIAAPPAGTATREPADDYKVMDDLDLAGPAPAGNFMRVIRTDEVFRKDRDLDRRRAVRVMGEIDSNGNWDGKPPWDDPKWATRPNYKAFVRNTKRPSGRGVVSVILPPLPDYGMGNAYWKGDMRDDDNTRRKKGVHAKQKEAAAGAHESIDLEFDSMSITDDPAQARSRAGVPGDTNVAEPIDEAEGSDTNARHKATRGNRRGASNDIDIPDDHDIGQSRPTQRKLQVVEEEEEAPSRVSKPASGRTRTATTASSGTTASKSKKQRSAVIVSEDESAMDVEPVRPKAKGRGKEAGDAGSTLRSSAKRSTQTASQRNAEFVVMDDSDDEVRVRRKKR